MSSELYMALMSFFTHLVEAPPDLYQTMAYYLVTGQFLCFGLVSGSRVILWVANQISVTFTTRGEYTVICSIKELPTLTRHCIVLGWFRLFESHTETPRKMCSMSCNLQDVWERIKNVRKMCGYFVAFGWDNWRTISGNIVLQGRIQNFS